MQRLSACHTQWERSCENGGAKSARDPWRTGEKGARRREIIRKKVYSGKNRNAGIFCFRRKKKAKERKRAPRYVHMSYNIRFLYIKAVEREKTFAAFIHKHTFHKDIAHSSTRYRPPDEVCFLSLLLLPLFRTSSVSTCCTRSFIFFVFCLFAIDFSERRFPHWQKITKHRYFSLVRPSKLKN